MSKLHVNQTTTLTPEQHIAGLTDLGPGRSERFGNAWGGHSGHTYTFTQRPDGTTDIDYVVVREGKNLEGRFLGVVLGTVGKGVGSMAGIAARAGS